MLVSVKGGFHLAQYFGQVDLFGFEGHGRFGKGSAEAGQVGTPAAVGADVRRASQGSAFADEALDPAATLQFYRAQTQGRRNQCQKGAHPVQRHLVDLHLDGVASFASGHPDQAGLGWRGAGQGVQAVGRCGAGTVPQAAAPFRELIVQWQSLQMGADHCQFQGGGGVQAVS